MIEIRNLTRRFGPLTAVDDVSFDVARGEVLGFLGPNGAGKSTTMKMVTGFLTPDAGTVRVDGDDIAEKPLAVKRRIGYLPEGAPLYSDMTPRAFLRFVAEIRGFRGAEASRRIDAVVEQVSLQSALEKPIETLSKGFKRRVGLAQAILHDPDVLILDEPTDGLDPNQKHEVRLLLNAMAGDKAIVISTHILEEVEAVCSRAIIVSQGRIVADAEPAALQARSRYHNAVELRVDQAKVAQIQERLAKLPGVAAVEPGDSVNGQAALRALPHEGRDILAEVQDAIASEGVRPSELNVERGRLDEVFRQLTT